MVAELSRGFDEKTTKNLLYFCNTPKYMGIDLNASGVYNNRL